VIRERIGAQAANDARRDRRAQVVVLSANTSWNIANFRSALVSALVERGDRLIVVAPPDEFTPALKALGAEFVPITISSGGMSPLEDLALLARYRRIFRDLRPDIFLGVTIKPNIYGSLAARMAGARVINNISGLGHMFIDAGPLTRLASALYRLALRRSAKIFFQNEEDRALFVARGIVRDGQTGLLPGSGIDLERFKPPAAPRRPGPFRFLLASRLQSNKGITDYAAAARLVRRVMPDTVFQLLGSAGANRRMALPMDEVERWQAEGIIEYLGGTSDVRPAIAQADCVVLPSRREGMPRILLEGSAMGKPVIATDVPGCRDAVDDGSTGFLCAAQSIEALAEAMVRMAQLPAEQRLEMGRHGRRKMERQFRENFVVEHYLEAIDAA
jgi:glycosyltransferase involved in cell wall biosynthesis